MRSRQFLAGLRFFVLVGAVLGTLLFLRDGGSAATYWEVGAGRSSLDRGFEDWTSLHVRAEQKRDRRGSFGVLSGTRWFKETDIIARVGAYAPLTSRLDLQVEGGFSPTHEIAPFWSGNILGSLWLGEGWEMDGGWQLKDYGRGEDVHTGEATVRRHGERYWLGGSYFPSWAGEQGAGGAYRLAVGSNRESDGPSTGASLLMGDYLSDVQAGTGRLRDLTELAVWTSGPVNERVSGNGRLVYEDVDGLYRRIGFRIGIQWSPP